MWGHDIKKAASPDYIRNISKKGCYLHIAFNHVDPLAFNCTALDESRNMYLKLSQ